LPQPRNVLAMSAYAYQEGCFVSSGHYAADDFADAQRQKGAPQGRQAGAHAARHPSGYASVNGAPDGAHCAKAAAQTLPQHPGGQHADAWRRRRLP
jgi:hypothetical protein